jgi:hypothetical protein
MTEEEFYAKIPMWMETDKKTWRHTTLLGHFCDKYQKKNGVRFLLTRSSRDVFKSKESRDFAKLEKKFRPDYYDDLDSKTKKAIKSEIMVKIFNYVNWMLDYKFRYGNSSVNSTSVFLNPSFLNEFERMYNRHLKQHQQSMKMAKLLEWCNDEAYDIFDLHQIDKIKDLEMIKSYADSYNLDSSSVERRVLEKAKSLELI